MYTVVLNSIGDEMATREDFLKKMQASSENNNQIQAQRQKNFNDFVSAMNQLNSNITTWLAGTEGFKVFTFPDVIPDENNELQPMDSIFVSRESTREQLIFKPKAFSYMTGQFGHIEIKKEGEGKRYHADLYIEVNRQRDEQGRLWFCKPQGRASAGDAVPFTSEVFYDVILHCFP